MKLKINRRIKRSPWIGIAVIATGTLVLTATAFAAQSLGPAAQLGAAIGIGVLIALLSNLALR